MLLIDQLKTIKNLTDTENRIREYTLQHLSAMPTITIQQLAAASYTSHSAVIRLTKKLGFSGFKAFRYQLSTEIQRNALVVHDVDANFPFTPGDAPMAIAKQMADLTTTAISRALAQLNEHELARATDLLAKAERIYFFAIGDTQIRARSFQNKLVKIGKIVIIADEYNDSQWRAAAIRPQDCAVFLSYGGSSPTHTQFLKILAKRKIPTLVITGNPHSDQVKLADVALVTSQSENGDVLKVSTFASQVTFEYVLDVLFSIMYAREYQHNLVHLKTNYQEFYESKD